MKGNAALLLFMLWPAALFAQGFAGLGSTASGFEVPEIGTELKFPQDHGPHPNFRIEWWYVTANLSGPDATQYGVQWTLFRMATEPGEKDGWQSPQLWMGNAAVTTPSSHYSSERFARGGIGQAGATAEPFDVWIDEWRLSGSSDLSNLNMTAQGNDFAYDLKLNSSAPLVLHGQDGFSVKSEQGQASYYYSQPSFGIEGSLTLPSGKVKVSGKGWLDREWSSQPLSETQTGWDWFSLSFDDGARLMGFQLRQTDGPQNAIGTWIAPDGTGKSLASGELQMTPQKISAVSGRDIPTSWQVELAEKGLDIQVIALNPQSWMDTSIPYWEGPVQVMGSHAGRGYLEMTGYGE